MDKIDTYAPDTSTIRLEKLLGWNSITKKFTNTAQVRKLKSRLAESHITVATFLFGASSSVARVEYLGPVDE